MCPTRPPPTKPAERRSLISGSLRRRKISLTPSTSRSGSAWIHSLGFSATISRLGWPKSSVPVW
ncbi:MAG TPA: hypothetical protein VMR74_06270 [Gammaproteobacteria bacterium]|nr:hypothetical protein [Gammaproteobacteria bacterium]